MTARDLLVKQLDEAENQITQVIAGLDAEHAEARVRDTGMTIREQIQHLAEAAVATLASFEGRDHEWGTYVPEDRSWEGVKDARKKAQEKAIAALPDDDESLQSATRFLVGHVFYHVGQIASAQLTVHPEWDMFVIYRPAY